MDRAISVIATRALYQTALATANVSHSYTLGIATWIAEEIHNMVVGISVATQKRDALSEPFLCALL